MGKLMVGVARVLLVCALVLVLPSVAAAQSTQPFPGWYTNNGRAPIPGNDEWRIMWADSYIYQHPGTDNLYWYAHITYFNKSNKTLTLNCLGEDQLPPVREHITRGGTYLGYVDAEETFCDGNQSWVGSFKPGETFDDWVIFHNVPWLGDQVSLQWDPYGFSEWVNPWQSPFGAPQPPPPAVCPDELVKLGTCQPVSKIPEGKASNLVVLVHGCCTEPNDVTNDWENFGRQIAETIQTPGTWEVVVWDWTTDYTTTPPTPLTPTHDYNPLNNGIYWLIIDANTAYNNAPTQGHKLANAILNVKLPYKHVHLIAHSAGSNLIDTVTTDLFAKSVETGNKPFIHLTFLDAFTPHVGDERAYGCLADFAEHYVDKTTHGASFTDANLSCAFNFDITAWEPVSHQNPDEKKDFGHQWPIYWYQKSVTLPWYEDYGFRYGYPLSFEWGNNRFNTLPTEFPEGGCLKLNRITETAKCE